MKNLFFTTAFLFCQFFVLAQSTGSYTYKKATVMLPMRDGVKLFTIVLTPTFATIPMPILLNRTPYGLSWLAHKDTLNLSDLLPDTTGPNLFKEAYIIVWQEVRGKFKSEGTMQIHQPINLTNNRTDESTDTWDTIDWLIKNIGGNNGKAGIYGTSYLGWLALAGAVNPHPALKAAQEGACMADLFLGDDFHHNGAFRLSYAMEYTYLMQHDLSANTPFPFPQFDLYDWYLKLGPLKNVNEKYFHNNIPTWNHFVQHPNYDTFWQKSSPLTYVKYPQVPILHVGGYYDQEDMNGPQLMYEHMEKKDSFHRNYMMLGPWSHGQWLYNPVDHLEKISFEINTATLFNEHVIKWFDYWLKGIGNNNFDEAVCFQTGNNIWKTYSFWPPKNATLKNLYAVSNNHCSFTKPTISTGLVSYVSDPSNPVPYRTLPIEATFGEGSRWGSWQVEDQRFVYTRPDVVSFTSDSLTDDLIVTGKIMSHLFASTTGSDADWIVKLIDVYPNFEQKNLLLSGYQLPVAMEVFRGRFRKSFRKPEPLLPNKPEEFVIDLHQINHAFKKGHRLMIQIQSTWFPVIDRNPQKYVPNIFKANESDFRKATHTIYFSSKYPTHIELPVMK